MSLYTCSSPSRAGTVSPCSDQTTHFAAIRSPPAICPSGHPTATATSDYGSSEGLHIQQCVRCLHYGHDRCKRRPRCFRCGSFEHSDSSSCSAPITCLNCNGPHHSRYELCPSRLRELTIQQLMLKQGLSRKEAVQMASSFGVLSRSSAKSKSVAIQTEPLPIDATTQTITSSCYEGWNTPTAYSPAMRFIPAGVEHTQQPQTQMVYPLAAGGQLYACYPVQQVLSLAAAPVAPFAYPQYASHVNWDNNGVYSQQYMINT